MKMGNLAKRMHQCWVYVRGVVHRHRALALIMLLAFLFFTGIALVRHLGLHNTTYDLSIFYQAAHEYAHFREPSSFARGVDNLLGDHFHPILILLVPFLWVWDSPITLLLIQVLLIVAATPAIYLFARDRLQSHRLALAIAACGVFAPGVLFMVQFDFHELAFAVLLLAWAIVALYRENWWLFASMLVGLALTKENMFMVIIALGIVAMLRKRYVVGAVVSVLGMIGFFIVTKVVMPFFSGGGTYGYWSYTALGPDFLSSLKYVVLHPIATLQVALAPFEKIVLLAKTFVPVLGLSILSPLAVVLVPLLGERLLSSNSNYWEYGRHYQTLLGLVALFAAVDGIARIARYFKTEASSRKFRNITVACIAALTVVMMGYVMRFTYAEGGYRLDATTYMSLKEVQQIIPHEAQVCTTNHIGPYIEREKVIAVEWLTSAEKCDYLVLHRNIDGGRATVERQIGVIADGFEAIAHKQDWTVYQRK